MTELDDELRFHVEQRIAELMAKGASRPDAERLARQRLGDVADLAHYCEHLDTRITFRRRVRGWVADLGSDLRLGVHQIARQPGAALAVVLTLGLGIGSTTATYAVVHKLLISPLPYADADRIVHISRSNKERTFSVSVNTDIAETWRAGVPSIEDLALYATREVVADLGSGPEGVDVGVMSDGLLPVLGFVPAVGRGFDANDVNAAVISYGAWKRRFGGRQDVLGRSIPIDGVSHTVVGVLPRQFVVPFAQNPQFDVWVSWPTDKTSVFPDIARSIASWRRQGNAAEGTGYRSRFDAGRTPMDFEGDNRAG